MHFPLAQIENYLDDELLIAGELLLEQQQVGSPTEIERHLWLVRVQDGAELEVEVRISPSKVLMAACECETFRRQGACAHYAAALLVLRRHLAQRAEEKKRQQLPKSSSGRSSSIDQILAHASPEELTTFVRAYARHNRQFAIALKSRFLTVVPDEDHKAKSAELLDSIIAEARKADRSFSVRGLRKVLQVAEDMLEQAQHSLSRQHFADARDVSLGLIEKLTPLLRYAGEQREALYDSIQAAFEVLKELTAAPPALQDELNAWCMEEAQKLLYRSQGVDVLFFRLLAALSRSPVDAALLGDLLVRQTDKYLLEGRDPSPLLLLLIQHWESAGLAENTCAWTEKYLVSPEVLLFAVRHAISQSDWTRAAALAEAGLQRRWLPAIHDELEEALLQCAVHTCNADLQAHWAKVRLLKTLDIRYFKYWREARPSDGDRETLFDELRRLPFSHAKRRLLAGILADVGETARLAAFLAEVRSLDLLSEFGHRLLPEREAELLALYHALLGQYLKGHVGPRPSRRVRELVEVLRSQGGEAIAEKLVETLRAQYPERHTLQEALQLSDESLSA